MDLIISGYDQHDLDRFRLILDEIKARIPGETDEGIVAMALSRMYHDIVQPPIADEWTEEEIRQISVRPVRPEDLEGARKSILAFLERAEISA